MITRRRLLSVALITLGISVSALVVLANVLLGVRVDQEASTLLRTRADGLAATVVADGGRLRVRAAPGDASLDRDSWVFDHGAVVERPARADPRTDRIALTLARADRPLEREAPGDMRLRAEPIRVPGGARVGAIVVGTSTEALEDLREAVLAGSIVVAALVLLVGGLALRGAIDGAWRPVAAMTAYAEDWSEHDLERRFGLGAPSDELTGLAATLDALLTRIAASRRHEQRFADDVAHELRTPVTTLRMHASTGLAHPERGEQSFERVLAEADRLAQTIDALLVVGRPGTSGAPYAVDLRALALEVDGAEVSGPAELPRAEGEPAIIRRALAPLVANARRHARTGFRLELSAGDGTVEVAVCDDGPGVPPAVGTRVFEPGVGDDGSGAGLGLPLARRLARSCGGDVTLRPGRGGCFVLALPALGT
jgi:signal transduction histidine kinase